MEIFKSLNGDGTKWGVSDFYEEHEKILVAALASRKPFDTGWYSSKKECCTGRVWSDGQTVTCEVSVSDDFDTQGRGEVEAHPAGLGTVIMLEDVTRALDEAWDKASGDKRENEPYQGFKVLRRTRTWAIYAGGKPVGKSHLSLSWVETLILPKGDGELMDSPPGDYYHEWGWQNDCRQMPRKVRATLRTWAENWMAGKKVGSQRTCEGWTIQPWKD
jgi:hypothetical protein